MISLCLSLGLRSNDRAYSGPISWPQSCWNKLWRLAGRVAAPNASAAPAVHADCTSVPPYLPPVSLHWARYLTDPPAWPATPMTGGGDGDGFRDLWAPAIEPPCRLSSLALQSTPAPRPRSRSCSCPRRRGLTASGLSEHEHHLHRSLVVFPKLQGWWWPHGWK